MEDGLHEPGADFGYAVDVGVYAEAQDRCLCRFGEVNRSIPVGGIDNAVALLLGILTDLVDIRKLVCADRLIVDVELTLFLHEVDTGYRAGAYTEKVILHLTVLQPLLHRGQFVDSYLIGITCRLRRGRFNLPRHTFATITAPGKAQCGNRNHYVVKNPPHYKVCKWYLQTQS